MIERDLTESLLKALSDTPVVFLNGARQTGKSTLVRWLSEAVSVDSGRKYSAEYMTLDHAAVLSSARSDPEAFVAASRRNVIIDEVQRAPALFAAIKAEVDRKRTPGRFLLIGSADVLLLPAVSEALAGRVEVLTLWPFSVGELVGSRTNFVDSLFTSSTESPAIDESAALDRDELISLVVRGGFPEAVSRKDPARRKAWFDSYLTTIIQRDIRDMSSVEGLTLMPRLFSVLAHRVMTPLNVSELSRISGIPQSTLKRYVSLFESTFLHQSLPAWSRNKGKRLIRTPKSYLCDTGLACALLGLDEARLAQDPMALGPLLENFVVMEVRKQIAWSSSKPLMYHYRTFAGQEVDILLETPAGDLVGIEVKSSTTVGAGDFRSMKLLAETVKENFRMGIVLYVGKQALPFGRNLWALPVSAIWHGEKTR